MATVPIWSSFTNSCTPDASDAPSPPPGSRGAPRLYFTRFQGRTAVPVRRRRPGFIYADEFQNYTQLPTPLADVLAHRKED